MPPRWRPFFFLPLEEPPPEPPRPRRPPPQPPPPPTGRQQPPNSSDTRESILARPARRCHPGQPAGRLAPRSAPQRSSHFALTAILCPGSWRQKTTAGHHGKQTRRPPGGLQLPAASSPRHGRGTIEAVRSVESTISGLPHMTAGLFWGAVGINFNSFSRSSCT